MLKKANLFIVGAQKAGTTSVFRYLMQQKSVRRFPQKEKHYFDTGKIFNIPIWVGDKPFLVEASPSYCLSPQWCKKLYSFNEAAKIIYLTRNPIERLISQVAMEIKRGTEVRSETYVTHFINSRAKFSRLYRLDPSDSKNYLWRGQYADHIAYLEKIFPPQNLLVLDIADGSKESKLQDFLGTDLTGAIQFLHVGRDQSHIVELVNHCALSDYYANELNHHAMRNQR